MAKTPNILIFDYETGGLDPKTNAVTEFAGIIIDGESLEEISRYEAVLKPYSDDLLYDPKALEFTGISMEQINTGVDFKVFSKDFLQFLKRGQSHSHAKYKTLLAGHNVVFDIGFLQQLFFYMGKRIEDYVATGQDFYGNYYPKYFDTLPLSQFKWANEDMVSHKLTDCASKIGIEIVNAHRAMNDVIATKDLLINFIKSLRNIGITLNSEEILETRFRETFKF